jgi:divalent anion:Na+ symporter, DASS family
MTMQTLLEYRSAYVEPLLADTVLGTCRHETLARLLPHLHFQEFAAGERLFSHGDAARHAYLVIAGSVELEYRHGGRLIVNDGLIGEEAGTAAPQCQARATALTDVRALAIPHVELRRLVSGNAGLGTALQQLVLARLQGERAQLPEKASGPSASRDSWTPVAGWLCTLLLPLLVLFESRDWGLQGDAATFLAIFSATICMWVFNLVDDYVPGLFALFAFLVLDLAPPAQILSGFASDGFFLAMSILGIGTLIVASGLSYRFQLWLLLHLPDRGFWREFGLFVTGCLLTPVVPSANGRCALVAPLVGDMSELLHAPAGGKAATRLAASAFGGATLLSATFLTSKSVNFVIFGLLPSQAQNQFQWLNWALAGIVVAAVLVVFQFSGTALWFRGAPPLRLPKGQVVAQLALLGPMRRREWASLCGILLFTAGVMTTSIHKIAPPWLALAILYVLLQFGLLRKNEFKEKIDWPFLMYLGGLVGISSGFNAVGLDRWLAEQLTGLGTLMRTDLELFVLLLFAVLFVIRLAVPISATIVIAATVLMPLAEIQGANPWVIGMVVLVLGEMWFFPYQCSYYLQFREGVGKDGLFDERRFLAFNTFMNLARLAAITLSIPYWHWLGLL